MKAKGAKVSINPVKPGKGNFVVKTEKKNILLRQFEQIAEAKRERQKRARAGEAAAGEERAASRKAPRRAAADEQG